MSCFLCILHSPHDHLDQILLAQALLGGEGDQTDILGKLQVGPDGGQVLLDLALFELVHLIGDHHEGASGLEEVIRHGDVVHGGGMAGIHDQDAQGDSPGGEIALHQLAPTLLLGLGDLGVAVAG